MVARKMFLAHFELPGRAYTYTGGSCCPDNIPHVHAVAVRALHPNEAGALGLPRRALASAYGSQHHFLGSEQIGASQTELAQRAGVYGVDQSPGGRRWP